MLGLNNAKEEIFITDWWLCPELFLKRPSDDLQYRLDKILLKKANEGVKVYVMLFKEVRKRTFSDNFEIILYDTFYCFKKRLTLKTLLL